MITTNNLDDILTKYLGRSNIEPIIEVFNDTKYSPRGWQYKKFGNSSNGYNKLLKIKQEMEELEYFCKDTRSDYDLRAYQNYVFFGNNSIITVNTSPSRSGNSCTYTFNIYK